MKKKLHDWWVETSIRQILAGLPLWTGGPWAVQVIDGWLE